MAPAPTTPPPLVVAVTGAAGQLAYTLLPMILSGAVFGPTQPFVLHLLDVGPAMEVLRGLVMELEDSMTPLLRGILATDNPPAAFGGADIVLLFGASTAQKPSAPTPAATTTTTEKATSPQMSSLSQQTPVVAPTSPPSSSLSSSGAPLPSSATTTSPSMPIPASSSSSSSSSASSLQISFAASSSHLLGSSADSTDMATAEASNNAANNAFNNNGATTAQLAGALSRSRRFGSGGPDGALFPQWFTADDHLGDEMTMLLNARAHRDYGIAIEKYAKRTARVVVAAHPVNVNLMICRHFAPSFSRGQFTALSRLEETRATVHIARHIGVLPDRISNVVLWGALAVNRIAVDTRRAVVRMPRAKRNDGGDERNDKGEGEDNGEEEREERVDALIDPSWARTELPRLVLSHASTLSETTKTTRLSGAVAACRQLSDLFGPGSAFAASLLGAAPPPPPSSCGSSSIGETPNANQIFSLAVPADGHAYGIPADVVLSLPVRRAAPQEVGAVASGVVVVDPTPFAVPETPVTPGVTTVVFPSSSFASSSIAATSFPADYVLVLDLPLSMMTSSPSGDDGVEAAEEQEQEEQEEDSLGIATSLKEAAARVQELYAAAMAAIGSPLAAPAASAAPDTAPK